MKPGMDHKMSRFCVQVSWDEAPHLTKKQKDDLYAAIPPHQRESRTRGIPELGSGSIYPISEDDILVDPFDIPLHFTKVYGLDVGWNRTAAIWGAVDVDNDTVYLYAEHYRGQADPAIHVQSIMARGRWIPGVIDPASRGRAQHDGQQLLVSYTNLGLHLTPADNAVEAGIFDVWQRLSTGRLKVFRSMRNWLAEFRIYRRDRNGKVVKENDHAMDATRYLVRSGITAASQSPREEWGKLVTHSKHQIDYTPMAEGWMIDKGSTLQ